MSAGAAGATRHAVPDIDRQALAERGGTIVELGGDTMGTTWRVRMAPPAGFDAAPLAGAIGARLGRVSAQMSHWSPTSTLALYNRAAPGSWTRLPDDFAAVIAGGLAVARRTGGAFDPALGRLTDLWGLGPNRRATPPSPAARAAALAASGWRRLALAGPWLRQPGGLWLDLSGIAKGHAVDAVADLLQAAGVRHALVEIGGECVGRGVRPDGDPWWVELESPSPALPPLRVALHQLAVATSGNYVRGPHTLDPRTGGLVADAPAAVSVLHRSCLLADAWATALTVLPADAARRIAVEEMLAARIVAGNDEWLSPALMTMIEPG